MDDALVVIGHVGRPHGVRGEVRARATGPTLPALEPGAEVVATVEGVDRRLRLSGARTSGDALLLRFEGIDGRTDAAALTGATLSVPRDVLAALDADGEFYVRDLVGCAVRVDGEVAIGTVCEVHEGAANDALAVTGERGTVLVPFTRDAIVLVDLAAGEIVVRQGLLGGADG